MGRNGPVLAAVVLLLAQPGLATPAGSASGEGGGGELLHCGQIAPFKTECNGAGFAAYHPGADLDLVTIGFTGQLTLTLHQEFAGAYVNVSWSCRTVVIDEDVAGVLGNPPFVSPVCDPPRVRSNVGLRDLVSGFPVGLRCHTDAMYFAPDLLGNLVVVGDWGPWGCKAQF